MTVAVANVPIFAVRETPLAVVNPSEETNWEVPVLFPNKRLVANRLVEVVLVPVAFTQVRPVTPKVSTVRLAKEAFVAYRFVVVAFVEVTLPRTAFQRLVALPSE